MRWGRWAVMATVLSGCRGGDDGAAGDTSSSGGADTVTSAGVDTGVDSSGPPADSTDASTDASTGPVCAPNAAPASPSILEPVAGRIDVLADSLEIRASAFADPDPGDTVGALAVELWTIVANAPSQRVWTAAVADDSTLTLDDGTFEAAFATGLEAWTDYGLRARHSDDQGECSAWGEWSEFLGFRTDDGSSELFDESVVRDFYLEIGPESWDLIDAEAFPPGCVPYQRNYYGGTLRYEDQVFDNVGIKIKGGCGSSQDLSGKASFKVNLEWDDPAEPGCPPERRLLGEKKFAFHNGHQDVTASHERLGYALFRALDVPAPRAASVRVFVNDELWGLYTHVESIDRRFLSRWFASKEGMLYEGTYWCDLIAQNIGPGDEDDGYCLTREFSPNACSVPDPAGDPLDFSLLHALIDQIEALPNGRLVPALEAFVELDRFLTMWAVESVLSHWDNYAFSITNNYRVYHDPSSDRWSVISTGIDQTFVDDQNPFDAYGVLAVACLADAECEAAYAARLAEVSDAFANFGYPERAEAMFDQLAPVVQEDPRKSYSFATFVGEHAALGAFIERRPGEVQLWLDAYGL